MPTKFPRLNVVMEPRMYQAVLKLSKKQGLSLSLMARELLREAIILHEDAYWNAEAEKRHLTLKLKKELTHKQVWGS